jgi:hypothetical protein
MYIAFDRDTKKVVNTSNTKFISVSKNLEVAETENVPSNYDYLTVENLQEHTRVIKEAYTEEVTKLNEETNEEYTETVMHEQVIENYKTCSLVAHFKPKVELTESQKQAKYESLVEQYIRQKYSLSQELAILRQRDSKIDEFYAYNLYAEDCKARAKKEIYGV